MWEIIVVMVSICALCLVVGYLFGRDDGIRIEKEREERLWKKEERS